MRGDSRLALYVRGAGAGPDPRRRRRLDNCRARPQVTRDKWVRRAPTAVPCKNPAAAPRAATRKCGRHPSSAHAPSRPRRETGQRAPPAGGAARGVRGQPPRPAGEGLGSALAQGTPQGCRVEDETPLLSAGPSDPPTPAQGAPMSSAGWARGHCQFPPDEGMHRVTELHVNKRL